MTSKMSEKQSPPYYVWNVGNFSIGDYFRDEAITWAYELLTSPEWFDFPKDKLYMTYYPDDKDSYNRWIEVGVDPSHLIPIEDNFWEIGAGPSGPDKKSSLTVEKHLTQKILVFVCLQRISKTTVTSKSGISFCHNLTLILLFHVANTKNCHTRTLIRALVWSVWWLLSKAKTNFETDLFMPIIREVEIVR